MRVTSYLNKFDAGATCDCLLVFMYIFAFNLKGGFIVESAMVVCATLIVYAIINKEFFNACKEIFKNKFACKLGIFYLMINAWACICLLANHSTDFSFLKTFLHVFFQIITGILLYKFLEYRGSREKIVNYLVIAFLTQTIIQWSAFFLPPIRELVHFTKDAFAVQKGFEYGNMRAISLCGSSFFGLSAAYAIIALLYWSKKNTLFQNNRIFKFALYVVMMTGTFFAGRTGYVGMIIALIYDILHRIFTRNFCFERLNKEERVTAKILGVCSLIGILIVLFVLIFNSRVRNLFSYTFEPIYNLFINGTLITSSLESMFSMYVKIPAETFIFGDGYYANYYMGTDIGYHRVIFYMGILGFFLLFFMQLVIISVRKGKEKSLKLALLVLLLVLNLKGEIITWAITVLATVLLFCLQDHGCVNTLKRREN